MKTNLTVILLAGLAAAQPSPVLAESAPSALVFAAAAIDECAANDLSDDRVVYIEKQPLAGKGVALSACAIVDAPPPEVWPVLRDCEDYQEFLPGVVRSVLLERSESVARCEAWIDLPFPLGELRSIERAVEQELVNGGFERRWSIEQGTYRRMHGMWTLRPWGESRDRTLLVYQLDMDPETIVPDFLLRRAQSTTARKVFDAVRERVRLRFGRASVAAGQTGPRSALD